jgi:hypothetical protein
MRLSLRLIAGAAVLLAAPMAQAQTAAPADYAVVAMKPDVAFLTPEERSVVNLLIQAADQMSAIFLLQSAGKDPGHGFYPAGLTKAELEAYLAAHPSEKAAILDGYTVVQRQGDKLVTVPYSVIYKPQLDKAAALLDEAAAKTSNPSLKRFLTLRATSFRTNDYFQSEMAWMDLTGTPIEVAIGPYETYTDELYGQKTAFEAFVTLKDPAESKALDKYKGYLKAMEANLPVEDRYKNFKRGGDSPLAVAEQVRGGGDNTEGPQTIAFNLPNDERVREAKGAKKVILSNVLGAKYDRILKPIGERALVAQQAPLVNKKYMTLETLFHELSHSLGPGLDHRRWPRHHGQRRDERHRRHGRRGQGRRHGRLQHPVHDGEERAARRRAAAADGDLHDRNLPRRALGRRGGPRPGRGPAVRLPQVQGRVRLGPGPEALQGR